jgi:GDP/UDP-N,N'-diacetylbacillosamine 2-epimerase (hydrolysing)
LAKRKVCIVVASRANYGRVKTVLKAIDQHPDLELQLVVGASGLLHRFGSVIDIIERDGFEVAARVYSILEGENLTTMAKSTGLATQELATLFENLAPDVVITVADRFETMGTAIAASYMNICLAHLQGGEVSGSIDESVRHAVTKLAHLHFPSNQEAADILVRMGEDPQRIFVTGCPSMDIAAEAPKDMDIERFQRYGGVGERVDFSRPYLVVSQHPVTTEFGQGRDQINQTLEAVERVGLQTVWLWPNVDAGSDDIAKGLRVFRETNGNLPIHFYRNFSPEDYVTLINNCSCLVGNSSSGIREGSFLGVPVVNIGSRQNNRTRGANVMDVWYNAEKIAAAIGVQLEHGPYPPEPLYGDGKAGDRVALVLAEAEVDIQKKFYMG